MSKLSTRILISALICLALLAGVYASVNGLGLRSAARAGLSSSVTGYTRDANAPQSYATDYFGRMYQDMNDIRDCFGDPPVNIDD